MSIDGNRDRSTVETVYLELSDGQSHKFYEVTVNGTAVTIRYGKIGTAGQSSTSTHTTPEKAQAEATKKINEKLRKGYRRTGSEDDRPTAPDQSPPMPASTASDISLRSIPLAEWPIESRGGRSVYKFPLQRSLVAIEVTATCNSPTFTINLRIDPSSASNIAYHFDVRSHQGQIVQNTCITGKWGTEERLPIPVEFTAGQPFTLRIAVAETVVVDLNEQVLNRYAHRLPAAQINAIEILYPPGNLQVQSVQVFERVDAEIAIAHPASPLPATPASQPESGSPPSPPPFEPPRLPDSSELMTQFKRGAYSPRIAVDQLGETSYPLGFALNLEEPRYCNLNIPLPRSLACLEMVGTFNDLATSAFKVRLEGWKANKRELGYWFEFSPHRGGMVQRSAIAGVNSRDELIRIPSEIKSGEPFQFVLTFTTEGNIVFYLNNQPFYHNFSGRPDQPINFLHVSYDLSGGIEVQSLRVLELERAKAETEPLPPQPEPSPSLQVAQPTATLPDPSEFPPCLRDLPPQFEPLRSLLQQNLVPYIKIEVGEAAGSMDRLNGGTGDPLTVWQSKIGGNPYFPKNAEYPRDGTGQAMPLLMQINCADVPPIAGFDLPRVGMLQFYLGGPANVAESTPDAYRVLYFPEVSTDIKDLITDFSFIENFDNIREAYPEVYPVTFAIKHDLFGDSWQFESQGIPAELKGLYQEFEQWLWNYLLDTNTGTRSPKLGGYVDNHANEIADSANGRLLLELEHPSCCDDSFLFFIPDEQLRDRNFSDVEFYFLCD